METIKVKAAPGVRVPMESSHRKYITDSEAVLVKATVYYLLRLKEKDLVQAEDEPTNDVKAVDPMAIAEVVPAGPAADVPTEVSANEQTADTTTVDHNEVQ